MFKDFLRVQGFCRNLVPCKYPTLGVVQTDDQVNMSIAECNVGTVSAAQLDGQDKTPGNQLKGRKGVRNDVVGLLGDAVQSESVGTSLNTEDCTLTMTAVRVTKSEA